MSAAGEILAEQEGKAREEQIEEEAHEFDLEYAQSEWEGGEVCERCKKKVR